MSKFDIAADQLKCIRVLSTILPDGTLPMPSDWGIHTYPNSEVPSMPRLDGFFHTYPEPDPLVSVLREQLRFYVEKFGLEMTEKPHGKTGLISVDAIGTYEGIELRVWGTARPDETES